MKTKLATYLSAVLLAACTSSDPSAAIDIMADDSVAAGNTLDISVDVDDDDVEVTAQLGDQSTPLGVDPATPGRYIGFIVAPPPGDYDLTITKQDGSGNTETAKQPVHVMPETIQPSIAAEARLGETFDVAVTAPGASSAMATITDGAGMTETVQLHADSSGRFTGLGSLESLGTSLVDFAVTYPDGRLEHRLRPITIGMEDLRAQLTEAAGTVALEGSYVTYDASLIKDGLVPDLEARIAEDAHYMSMKLASGELVRDPDATAVFPADQLALNNSIGLVPTEAALKACVLWGKKFKIPGGGTVEVKVGITGTYYSLDKTAVDRIASGAATAAQIAKALCIAPEIAAALRVAALAYKAMSAVSTLLGGDGGVTVGFLFNNPTMPVIAPHLK